MPGTLKFLLFFLITAWSAQAQELKVLITEKKQGKRLELIAENKTADTLNVFLAVKAEGYRRSASKPVIKDIPPYSKVSMITLIELANTESRYTFDLVVNDRETAVEMDYDHKERDIERVIRGQVVLFTVEGCEKCELLSAMLSAQRISFRSFDIHQDRKLYGQFMSFIERRLTNETKIRFPVIWNRDDVIFGYDEVEDVMQELTQK